MVSLLDRTSSMGIQPILKPLMWFSKECVSLLLLAIVSEALYFFLKYIGFLCVRRCQ